MQEISEIVLDGEALVTLIVCRGPALGLQFSVRLLLGRIRRTGGL